jgi:hypothetical protein
MGSGLGPAQGQPRSSPPAHPSGKLSWWLVGDAYFHRLVGAHLESDFIACELDMPDLDRRVTGEQWPPVAFHLQAIWRLGHVIE